MTARFRLRQAWAIARIEMRRAFFSKRAFWVYLLALFPAVLFIGHAIEVRIRTNSYQSRAPVPAAALDSLKEGLKEDEVIQRLGQPIEDRTLRRRHGDEETRRRWLTYYDGSRRISLRFEDGVLDSVNTRTLLNFEEDRSVFARIFQFFYLRLAIFFGCLGIFMNLFRGEMLDKTLHFWFLAPARREVLLAGKYLAGLVASTVIFTGGAMLCFGAMLWPYGGAELQAYWQGPGPMHALRYALASTLGCVGYGSVFLAAGLLLRNPIVPAAVLLLWEGINGFLPDILQKLSVLYYLQSLCPIPAPMDKDIPAVMRLLLAPAAPANPWLAVLGLLAVTALVLWVAARAVRRLEINYGTD